MGKTHAEHQRDYAARRKERYEALEREVVELRDRAGRGHAACDQVIAELRAEVERLKGYRDQGGRP